MDFVTWGYLDELVYKIGLSALKACWKILGLFTTGASQHSTTCMSVNAAGWTLHACDVFTALVVCIVYMGWQYTMRIA
jgi:hypothetical protein